MVETILPGVQAKRAVCVFDLHIDLHRSKHLQTVCFKILKLSFKLHPKAYNQDVWATVKGNRRGSSTWFSMMIREQWNFSVVEG